MRIICEQIKTTSFSNGDSDTWDSLVTKHLQWLVENGLEIGYRDLMLSLMQTGQCFSYDKERINRLLSLLKNKGFN